MIPQTVVGFFFFLLLVAPGVGYELLRERRTPKIDESAFREAARVALYSFGFSFAALVIISLLRIYFPTDLFDLGAYSRDSMGYVKSHYMPVLWTVVLEVLLAFMLVVVVDRINAAKPYSRIYQRLPKSLQTVLASDIRRHGIWWDILVASRPKGQIAQLSIRLSDGSRVIGFFYMCTAYDNFDKAEICIKRGAAGPLLLFDTQDPNEQKLESRKSRPLDQDDFIWVRGEDISYMRVRYKPIHTSTQPPVPPTQLQPPPIVGGPAPSAPANPAAAMATEEQGKATDRPAQTHSKAGGSQGGGRRAAPELTAALRILVYSDDRAVREQVKLALGKRIYPELPELTYIEVATGPMVIKQLDDGDVDLVILDGEATPGGGMGIARQLKDELSDCPPIVVLAARADDSWLADWSRAEAVVSHPIDPFKLVDAVVPLLGYYHRPQGRR